MLAILIDELLALSKNNSLRGFFYSYLVKRTYRVPFQNHFFGEPIVPSRALSEISGPVSSEARRGNRDKE
jgi:hypothetical protein